MRSRASLLHRVVSLYITIGFVVLILHLAPVTFFINISALEGLRAAALEQTSGCSRGRTAYNARMARNVGVNPRPGVIRWLSWGYSACGDYDASTTILQLLMDQDKAGPIERLWLAQLAKLRGDWMEAVKLLKPFNYQLRSTNNSSARDLYLESLLHLSMTENNDSNIQRELLDEIISANQNNVYALSVKCVEYGECSPYSTEQVVHFSSEQITDPSIVAATAQVVPTLVNSGIWSNDIAIAVVDFWISVGMYQEAVTALDGMRCAQETSGQAQVCLARIALCLANNSCSNDKTRTVVDMNSLVADDPVIREWLNVLRADYPPENASHETTKISRLVLGKNRDDMRIEVRSACTVGQPISRSIFPGIDDVEGLPDGITIGEWNWASAVGQPQFDDALFVGNIVLGRIYELEETSEKLLRTQGLWTKGTQDRLSRVPRAGWQVDLPITVPSHQNFTLQFCYRTRQIGEAPPSVRLQLLSNVAFINKEDIWLPATNGEWFLFDIYLPPLNLDIEVKPFLSLWSEGVVWFSRSQTIEE